MKPSDTPLTADPVASCATLVMDTVPLLMRTIRQEMRRQRPAEISMPQFRALRILQRHPEISLSQMAQCLDLTLATTSKLVDVLEKHALVARVGCPTDHRKLMISLSTLGAETLEQAREAAETRLAELLAQLSADDCAAVAAAMLALRAVVGSEG